jgi:hypothetical protein
MYRGSLPPNNGPRKAYANKWNPQRNWIWRLRGKAVDGLVVTLGRYETTDEAQADLARITVGGGYRDLILQPLEPAPLPAAE